MDKCCRIVIRTSIPVDYLSSDGERSLEWQTPAVAYPFGSLHDYCVAVVVVLLDEVVCHFRRDLSILLIICQSLRIPSCGAVANFVKAHRK